MIESRGWSPFRENETTRNRGDESDLGSVEIVRGGEGNGTHEGSDPVKDAELGTTGVASHLLCLVGDEVLEYLSEVAVSRFRYSMSSLTLLPEREELVPGPIYGRVRSEIGGSDGDPESIRDEDQDVLGVVNPWYGLDLLVYIAVSFGVYAPRELLLCSRQTRDDLLNKEGSRRRLGPVVPTAMKDQHGYVLREEASELLLDPGQVKAVGGSHKTLYATSLTDLLQEGVHREVLATALRRELVKGIQLEGRHGLYFKRSVIILLWE